MGKPNVSGADLYALREFLVMHYGTSDPKFKQPYSMRFRELFGATHYLFTHVNGYNNPGFNLRRCRHFGYYDLASFVFFNGSIQVEKREIKDEMDAEKIKGLAEVLRARCYSGAISNLEQLTE
jgi:hypothetical protein